MDSSEIIHTLQTGGVAALGYASAAAGADSEENVNTVTSTTRDAFLNGTSLPEAGDAAAVLLVVAGRAGAIPRTGIEHARRWLEAEAGTHQVRGGDFPVGSDRIAVLVLLSGVERSPRVQSFLERATEAQVQADDTDDPVDAVQTDDLDSLL